MLFSDEVKEELGDDGQKYCNVEQYLFIKSYQKIFFCPY